MIKNRSKLDIVSDVKRSFSQIKPLLLFSLPLLAVALLNTSTNWVNTLMLAGLKTAAELGLFKVAGVITGFIGFPIGILLVIYMPVVSNLFGSNKINEIKRIYTIVTKWICFLTLPLFIFLFIFSEKVIGIIYGNEYIIAANTFRILSLATIFTNFAGPNGATLVSIGKPRFVMYSILVASIVNILLNIFLIPRYGIEGAAVSVSIALVSFNVIKGSVLYSSVGVTSLNYKLIKPTISTLLMIFILYYIFKNFLVIKIWMIPIFFISFYLIYFLFFLFTKSIDKEDIEMIKIIGDKIHIKTDFLTNIMYKFKN